jgi:hypothetical protein
MNEKQLLIFERIACAAFIIWLQVVGVRTYSIVHHILHAAPIALLLFIPQSPSRHFAGLLAGFLWVFMLGVITSMLHNSLILGYIITHSHIPYTWLAPIAAILAVIWAAANAALLSRKPRWLAWGLLVGIVLIGLFAWLHPYLTQAFNYPIYKVLGGQYLWVPILLLETTIVLALPSWCAFRLSKDLRVTKKFIGWQLAYWAFFVAAMVAGLLPIFNRR